MAGVGDEGPLARERHLEPGEHRVERRAQTRDLVTGCGDRKTLARLVLADRGRLEPHRVDRPQRRGGNAVPGERCEQQRERSGDRK